MGWTYGAYISCPSDGGRDAGCDADKPATPAADDHVMHIRAIVSALDSSAKARAELERSRARARAAELEPVVRFVNQVVTTFTDFEKSYAGSNGVTITHRPSGAWLGFELGDPLNKKYVCYGSGTRTTHSNSVADWAPLLAIAEGWVASTTVDSKRKGL